MSRYQHTKGQIQDNAVEKNRKGKGRYQRKEKHAGRNGREASGKKVINFLTTGLLLLTLLKNDCFVLSTGHEFR